MYKTYHSSKNEVYNVIRIFWLVEIFHDIDYTDTCWTNKKLSFRYDHIIFKNLQTKNSFVNEKLKINI